MKEVVRTLKAFSEEKKRLEAELNQAYSNMDFASSKKINQSQILVRFRFKIGRFKVKID